MDTSIVKFENDNGEEVEFTAEDIHNLVNPEAPAKDIALFMAFCKAHKLDPIGTKDAYLVGYNGRNGYQASIITSYHVFNKIACAHDTYDGIESGIIVADPAGNIVEQPGAAFFGDMGFRLLGGWARVYDHRRSHPFYVRVALKDYDTGRSQWKSRPALMIEKVAKCQAWRGAYPELRDMYDSSEMGRVTDGVEEPSPAYEPPAPVEVVDMTPEPVYEAPAAPETPDVADPAPEVQVEDDTAMKAALASSAAKFANARGRDVSEVFGALLHCDPMAGFGVSDVEELTGESLRAAVQIVSGWAEHV